MNSKLVSPILLGLVLVAIPVRAEEPPHHAGGDPRKLGLVEFPNTCSPAVQQPFAQALAMLHSFWYEAARRRFAAVAQQDPNCAIAWWGLAMTYWQPLWEPRGPNPETLRKGQEVIEKAQAAGSPSKRECDFVAALEAFYVHADTIDHRDRVLAYEKAMETLHANNPKDTEARVFYALSLLASATSLPPDKTYQRQKKAGELLLPVFRSQPAHPGAAHYIIHADDYPDLASAALEAARRYTQIAPDSPHAQHMPSHIFTRLGLWRESIESNRKVIKVARRHEVVGEELHATDYLIFAYLQQGQDPQAQAVIASMPKIPGPEAVLYFASIYAHAAIPARYAVERRQWNEAARLPEPENFPGGRYVWADAVIYFTRALGAARTGMLEQARAEVRKLASFQQTLEQLKEDYWAGQVDIQRRAAAAWLAFAEGKRDKALELMRSAATLEEATNKHPVTPAQIVPARDLLGQMLLELNRPREAGEEFTKVLNSEPNRFGALYGAARAAELAGEGERARKLYNKLIELAPESDRAEVRHARALVTGKWIPREVGDSLANRREGIRGTPPLLREWVSRLVAQNVYYFHLTSPLNIARFAGSAPR
jgi:tetratricopeptide (TPR) repeat protein